MRVFLGITNNAGVLTEYRKGLRRLGVDARVIVNRPHRYGYFHDEVIQTHENPLFRRFQGFNHMIRFIRDFDIFHFFSGASIIPLHIDVPFLKMANKKILMSFMGSDIRCNKKVLTGQMQKEECKYCRNSCKYNKKHRNVKFWSKYADVIFALPSYAQILNYHSINYQPLVVPIDTNDWKPFESHFLKKDHDKILIVHASSNPNFKGTRSILSTINELKSEGYPIKFKLLLNVTNNIVKEWVNASDIVIDQFGMGWYGKFSIESMALAKPTICYIRNEYKKQLRYGKNLPLASATPNNLYSILEELINSKNLRAEIGIKSREYVTEIHDSNIVCKKLLDTYKKII